MPLVSGVGILDEAVVAAVERETPERSLYVD